MSSADFLSDSPEELSERLITLGVNSEWAKILKENEISGSVFLDITEQDVYQMFPGKVGIARKIMKLQQELVAGERSPAFKESKLVEGVAREPRAGSPPSTSGAAWETEQMEPSAETGIATEPSQGKLGFSLPCFSQKVEAELAAGNMPSLSILLEECAHHIWKHDKFFNTSDKYREFSKAMHDKYPCAIRHQTGRHPWSWFSQKLSEKMRNFRYARKKKGVTAGTGEGSTVGALVLADAEPAALAPEDAEKQLREEFEKPFGDWNLIFQLFKLSKESRRKSIQAMQTLHVSQIMKEHPILGKMEFIREEFFDIRAGVQEDVMLDNYLIMLSRLDSLKNSDMEAEEALKSGHGCTLESTRLDPPSLVIVRHQSDNLQGYVLADGVVLPCSSGEPSGHVIFEFLVDVMACYYSWDLDYPKSYQFFGFLQTYVINDRENSYYSSSKFKNFQKKYDP